MAVTWGASADKHHKSHEDALHAITNALYVEVEFDEPTPPNTHRPHLYIGPQRDAQAPLLEVMVESRPPRGLHVFHVMEARKKHLVRMEKPDDAN